MSCKGHIYSTLFNYNRIEDTYKIAFLQRFSIDFYKHKECGELDLKYFSYKEKRELQMIMEFPELYPRMYEVEVERFNSLLKNRDIWIYGAGKIAERTWDILTEENRYRVKGVLVSDLAGNEKTFHGFPITQLGEEQREKDYMVVMAVSLKNSEVVIENLRRNNIQEYILVKEHITEL